MTAYSVPWILGKNKNLILASLIFFIVGVISGFLSFESAEKQLVPLLKDVVFANIIEESKFQTAINIFSRNFWAATLLLVSGITVVIPILILFSNGFVVGFVMKLTLIKNLDTLIFIKGVLPHSIFELSAFLISAAVGIRTGLVLLDGKDRKRNLISHLKETIFIYIFVIIPLILIAAFIEAFVSAALVGIY